MTVKVRLAAPSTVAAVLLALYNYGVDLDSAIHRLIDGIGQETGSSTQSRASAVDYDSALAPVYVALDSSLPTPPTPAVSDASTRLTLAVADGETLAGVLAEADVPADDARSAIEAMRRTYDPRKLRAGQSVTVSYSDRDGRFRGFELQPDLDHRLSVTRSADGFAVQQATIPLKTETRAAHGVIRNSLFDSAAQVGVPYSVTAAMIRAFSYDVDFQRDIQPGDRFEIMYDNMVGQSGAHPGNLLYAQLTLSGRAHAIYGFRRDDGTLDFFTRDGKSVRRGLLRTPVDGARLSSSYGMRLHPIMGFTRMHKGVDFAVPTGSPIYAAGDGVVEQSGWSGSYGRYVRIRHGAQMATAYAHLSRIASAAGIGAHVYQGEVIGYVGMTGSATGPHLHYEVVKNGAQVNPISVSLPVSTGLEEKDMVAFRRAITEHEQRYAALATGNRVAIAPSP